MKQFKIIDQDGITIKSNGTKQVFKTQDEAVAALKEYMGVIPGLKIVAYDPDIKQHNLAVQSYADMMKEIGEGREKAIRDDSNQLSNVALSASKIIAPKSYESTMRGDTAGEQAITALKESGPTIAGTLAGAGLGSYLGTALPIAASGVIGALGKTALTNIAPAVGGQIVTDIGEAASGQENSFKPSDYAVATGLGALGTGMKAASPVLGKILSNKLMQTGEFINENEALKRAKQAFGSAPIASVKKWLVSKAEPIIADLKAKLIPLNEQVRTGYVDDIKLSLADNKMLKAERDGIAAQLKNTEKNLQDNLARVDKDDYFALGKAQEMAAKFGEGPRIRGSKERTVDFLSKYKPVDLESTPEILSKQADIERLRRSADRLAPAMGQGVKPYNATGVKIPIIGSELKVKPGTLYNLQNAASNKLNFGPIKGIGNAGLLAPTLNDYLGK